jgi:hypothetical protein
VARSLTALGHWCSAVGFLRSAEVTVKLDAATEGRAAAAATTSKAVRCRSWKCCSGGSSLAALFC